MGAKWTQCLEAKYPVIKVHVSLWSALWRADHVTAWSRTCCWTADNNGYKRKPKSAPYRREAWTWGVFSSLRHWTTGSVRELGKEALKFIPSMKGGTPTNIHTHMYVRGVCLYMCVMRQSCDEPFVVDWEVEECEESSQGMQGLSYQPPSPLPVWGCVCPPHFHSIALLCMVHV